VRGVLTNPLCGREDGLLHARVTDDQGGGGGEEGGQVQGTSCT